MKFETAKQLADAGQLNDEHKQEINIIIKCLNQLKNKEILIKNNRIRRFNRRIEKWERIIKNN
jgi:flagellin-specific chaperone FliS